VQITLELAPGSDPIRGTVRGETATRGFTGWMQLISALQAAIEEGHSLPSEPARGAHASTYPNHTSED
jgi:hypothetical protein